MTMTAKEICSEVYGLSGFSIPSSGFVEGSDPDDKLIFFLLRRLGRDIAKYRWQELVRSAEIVITKNKSTYSLPADFREFIPRSIKTKEDLRDLGFPTSFDEWSRIDSKVGITGVRHRLRLQAGLLTTLPSDTDSYTIRFDYISNYPVYAWVDVEVGDPTQDEGSRIETQQVYQAIFEKDADVWTLDDDLIIKGLKAKWSVEKGLDTLQADIVDFNNYLLELKGTNAASQKIRMTGRTGAYFPQAPYTDTWK